MGTANKAFGRRAKADTYLTRPEIAFAALDQYLDDIIEDLRALDRPVHVLGMGMGVGVWEYAARKYLESHELECYITAIEIEPAYLTPPWVDCLITGDALTYKYPRHYDIVVTNPPFKHLMEFIMVAEQVLEPLGKIVVLAPNDFTGSIGRVPLLGETGNYTPCTKGHLVERPSFYSLLLDMIEGAYAPHGTDGHEACILTFDKYGFHRKGWSGGQCLWSYWPNAHHHIQAIQTHYNMSVYRAIFEASRTLVGPLLHDTPSLMAAGNNRLRWIEGNFIDRLELRQKEINSGLTEDTLVEYAMFKDGKNIIVPVPGKWLLERSWLLAVPKYDFTKPLKEQYVEHRKANYHQFFEEWMNGSE